LGHPVGFIAGRLDWENLDLVIDYFGRPSRLGRENLNLGKPESGY